ncbi:MAG: AAA family ATPase [Fimbriimonadaceae bacterium]|nr:AAA family ATPase [Fimbriimonadaceae bacterium]
MEDLNPWWAGKPGRILPKSRRWPYERMLRHATAPVPIAPILVVKGARQIGKTTLQEQVIKQLLIDGYPPERILRLQFEDLPNVQQSDLRLEKHLEFFESAIMKRSFNEAAHEGRPALVFLDEVQNLAKWSETLKSFVDRATVRVFVTGSSALRISLGRDSLAGRMQTLEVGPLRLSEIAEIRGLSGVSPFQESNGLGDWDQAEFWNDVNAHAERQPDLEAAFKLFSDWGAYPLAHKSAEHDWQTVSAQLRETVVTRVITHDLRIGERGRKRDPDLLQDVFRLACRNAGQIFSPGSWRKEFETVNQAIIGDQRIENYLRFLNESLLIHLVEPQEFRQKKRRTREKICLSDHALRAAVLGERVPLVPEGLAEAAEDVKTLAGFLAESCTGGFLSEILGSNLRHKPSFGSGKKLQPEIDFVMNVNDSRIPVEIKYRRTVSPADLAGLRTFLDEKLNKAPFGLLITQRRIEVSDPRIISVPLSNLLLVR